MPRWNRVNKKKRRTRKTGGRSRSGIAGTGKNYEERYKMLGRVRDTVHNTLSYGY
jgi:hypothetical protein